MDLKLWSPEQTSKCLWAWSPHPPTRHPSRSTSSPRLLPQWVAACAVEDKTWPESAGALPGAGPAAVPQNGPVTKDWGCLGNNIGGLSCLQQRSLLFWL